MSDEQEPDSSVGWCTRLAFGVGALGEGTVLGASHVFLLFYYNHVLGLSGGLAGAALGVATVIDALTDPLVGSLSDGTRSRLGRRHPWMYGSVLPSALLFYLLFNPPAGLPEMTLFLWLTLTASGTRAALTLFSIPHMSMGAELSTDYDERTGLASARGFFRQAGTLTVALVGFGVFFQAGNGFKNGQLNPDAYPPSRSSSSPASSRRYSSPQQEHTTRFRCYRRLRAQRNAFACHGCCENSMRPRESARSAT